MNMERWRGKTAVVTGGCSGIGAGISSDLASNGVNVVCLDIRTDDDGLQVKVPEGGMITTKRCDVSKPVEVGAAFEWIEEKCGAVHILVNCAGVLYPGHITDVGSKTLDYEQISRTIDVNLKATILCARHAVASMKKHDLDGHIININSLAGHNMPISDTFNVYAATKHAITAFTASLNLELAQFKHKIKTTSISPGLVDTELANYLKFPKLSALIPQDIADAVRYVLSTSPRINISELTITSVNEKLL